MRDVGHNEDAPARCIAGQSLANAKHTIDDVCSRDKEVCDNMTNIPLSDSTGIRKQKTAVADIQTVLRIIVQVQAASRLK